MVVTRTEKKTDKEKLLAKKKELREKLEAIEADYRRGLDPDSEERAVQLENAEVLDGIAKVVAEELERIEEELTELS